MALRKKFMSDFLKKEIRQKCPWLNFFPEARAVLDAGRAIPPRAAGTLYSLYENHLMER
jgi:hypothetical protein